MRKLIVFIKSSQESGRAVKKPVVEYDQIEFDLIGRSSISTII
jgi:hypothetical protein